MFLTVQVSYISCSFVLVKTNGHLHVFIAIVVLNVHVVVFFNFNIFCEFHDEILNAIIHTCMFDSFMTNCIEMDFWKQGLPSEIFVHLHSQEYHRLPTAKPFIIVP